MTNTASASFLITECPTHGSKECSDYAAFIVYVDAALADDFGNVW